MKRIISKLDVKGPNLVKGVCLEGLRVLGEPSLFAKKYFNQMIDEILIMVSFGLIIQRYK